MSNQQERQFSVKKIARYKMQAKKQNFEKILVFLNEKWKTK